MMKDKVLHGQELTAAQQEEADRVASELHRAEIEMEERRRQEARMQEEILERQEDAELKEEQYGSLKEEEEVKTRKLKKLHTKFKSAQREVADLQDEFQAERDAMLETIRDLQRQLKYSNLVIDNFIPWEHLEKLEQCSHWDELQNEWLIDHVEHAGNHVAAQAALMQTDGNQLHAGFGGRGVASCVTQDFYDPYSMDGGFGGEVPMQQVDNYQAMAFSNADGAGAMSNVFFSYNPDGTPLDEDPQQVRSSKSRPESGQGKRNKSARPKSGRPGSARSKSRAQVACETSGLVESAPIKKREDMIPKARGLVASRPPSARVRLKHEDQ